MILNEFLSVLYISFIALSSPRSPSYDHSANIGFQSQLKSCVVETTNDNPSFIDAQINLTAQLDYDNESSFQLSNFNITVYLNFYYVSNVGVASLEDSLSYKYSPTWSFTNSNYSSSGISRFNFTYGVDSDDDEMYIKYYDDDTLVSQQRLVTDNAYYYSSYINYNLDESSFMNAVLTRLQDLHIVEGELDDAYQEGFDDGRVQGYQEGAGHAMNPEMFTIFNGILNVAMVPVNVFLKIFNWEVFGINISSMVSALFSIAILIIIIRLVTGKKGDGD